LVAQVIVRFIRTTRRGGCRGSAAASASVAPPDSREGVVRPSSEYTSRYQGRQLVAILADLLTLRSERRRIPMTPGGREGIADVRRCARFAMLSGHTLPR
jgi:hypothetical protein